MTVQLVMPILEKHVIRPASRRQEVDLGKVISRDPAFRNRDVQSNYNSMSMRFG